MLLPLPPHVFINDLQMFGNSPLRVKKKTAQHFAIFAALVYEHDV